VMVCPAAPYVVGLLVLVSANAFVCAAITVEAAAADVTPPPEAVALLTTEPASRSACVATVVAEHVIDAPGARVVAEGPHPNGVPPLIRESATAN